MIHLSPSYSHMNYLNQVPTKSNLNSETAFPAYEKLRNNIAISLGIYCPAEGWDEKRPRRDLFRKDGFHWKVQWVPRIDLARERQLTYEEFCVWYGIKL
jgi:hypothetical protein